MNQQRDKIEESVKVTDCLDDEVLCFYVDSFQCPPWLIKEGQRVSYVVEVDANGRRYATDIRIEDDEDPSTG
ncbi:hypothetical protein [Pseudomonas sp. NPDC089569]|uniref:hypothetical protein n=1 Tax=Pseudomonas sp. NPDC089569 TaxID=3390722 RepID=UPI003D08489B